MSRDLDQLLHDTAVVPADRPDASELVARGRRRRVRRHAAGTVAGVAAAVLVGVAVLQAVPTGSEPEILDQPPGDGQPATDGSTDGDGRESTQTALPPLPGVESGFAVETASGVEVFDVHGGAVGVIPDVTIATLPAWRGVGPLRLGLAGGGAIWLDPSSNDVLPADGLWPAADGAVVVTATHGGTLLVGGRTPGPIRVEDPHASRGAVAVSSPSCTGEALPETEVPCAVTNPMEAEDGDIDVALQPRECVIEDTSGGLGSALLRCETEDVSWLAVTRADSDARRIDVPRPLDHAGEFTPVAFTDAVFGAEIAAELQLECGATTVVVFDDAGRVLDPLTSARWEPGVTGFTRASALLGTVTALGVEAPAPVVHVPRTNPCGTTPDVDPGIYVLTPQGPELLFQPPGDVVAVFDQSSVDLARSAESVIGAADLLDPPMPRGPEGIIASVDLDAGTVTLLPSRLVEGVIADVLAAAEGILGGAPGGRMALPLTGQELERWVLSPDVAIRVPDEDGQLVDGDLAALVAAIDRGQDRYLLEVTGDSRVATAITWAPASQQHRSP